VETIINSMNLIITTKEELEELVKTSVKNGIKEYFLEQELKGSKDPYITVQEAAVRLKVSNLTVRNYVKRGLFKACKVGNRILIDNKSIEIALSEVKSLKYKI
jgi:excisionase family DNA binding protein